MKKTFILRRETNDTESDRYMYWTKTTMTGLELTTPFRENATRVKEDEPIDVVSKNWNFIQVKK